MCIRDLVLMFSSILRMLRKILMRSPSEHGQSRKADIKEENAPTINRDREHKRLTENKKIRKSKNASVHVL